jgi:hypothetical protein
MAKCLVPGIQHYGYVLGLILFQKSEQNVEKAKYRIGRQAPGIAERRKSVKRAKNI